MKNTDNFIINVKNYLKKLLEYIALYLCKQEHVKLLKCNGY